MKTLIEVKVLYRTGKSKEKRKPVITKIPIGFSFKLLREIVAQEIGRRSSGIHIKNVEILTSTN